MSAENEYRVLHEPIARRIATALRELSDAVQAERALHALAGRSRLPALGFPTIGDWRNPKSPSGRWLANARRHGYPVDDPSTPPEPEANP